MCRLVHFHLSFSAALVIAFLSCHTMLLSGGPSILSVFVSYIYIIREEAQSFATHDLLLQRLFA